MRLPKMVLLPWLFNSLPISVGIFIMSPMGGVKYFAVCFQIVMLSEVPVPGSLPSMGPKISLRE